MVVVVVVVLVDEVAEGIAFVSGVAGVLRG